MGGQGVADFGAIDDHKESIAVLDVSAPTKPETPSETEHAHADKSLYVSESSSHEHKSHSHSHSHGDHAQGEQDYDPNCTQCNEEGHGHVRYTRAMTI